jgi:hypothetical protein
MTDPIDDPDVYRAAKVQRVRDAKARRTAATRPQTKRGRCNECGWSFRVRSERSARAVMQDHCKLLHTNVIEVTFTNPALEERH